MTTELPPDEAHLWYVATDEPADDAEVAGWLALLPPDERARHDALLFERKRREFLLTRLLVRSVLSMYAPVERAAWRFRAGSHGKPEIDLGRGVPGAPPLRFNLSNTDGMVVLLVAAARDVGVDVEPLARKVNLGVADRFFSPDEVRALFALPEPARRERFLEYWTLKESYIKARGLGLAIPLARFGFHLDDGPLRIAIDPRLADDPAWWHFERLRPTEDHLVAAAVRRAPGENVVIRARRFALR